MQKINSGVTAPKGFLAGGVHCGVKTNNTAKKDIAIIYSEKPCTAAAVYTQNKVFGAPITVTRRNIADGMAQAVVCNSGNANTCNADGVEKAERMCLLAAKELGIPQEGNLAGRLFVSSGGYHCSLYRCHRAGASHRAHRKGHCGTGSHHFQRRQSGCRAGHHDHRHQAQGRGL